MKSSATIIAAIGLAGGFCLTAMPGAYAAAVSTTKPMDVPTTKPMATSGAMSPMGTRHAASQDVERAYSHRIAVLQEALNGYTAGPGLTVDGIWGPKTERALRLYQRAHGLPATGRMNASTRAMLDPIG